MGFRMDYEYLDVVQQVLEYGSFRGDRTGTGTKSLFNPMPMIFNLDEAFPLLTLKRTWFKGVVGELLWFIRGDDNIDFLLDNSIHIWDNWRAPYGFDREVVLVERRTPVVPADFNGPFQPSSRYPQDSEDEKLAQTWSRMMRRCYDPGHHRYSLYGGSGVTVHPRWHDTAVFVDDAKKLPHWRYKRADWDGFQLDKDYYGASQYGPDTSVWLRADENSMYTRASCPIEVFDVEGERSIYPCQNEAARRIGMSTSSMSRFLVDGMPTILKGANKRFAGWEIRDAALSDNQLVRFQLIDDNSVGPVYGYQWRRWPVHTPGLPPVDQLADVIQQIKENPTSRRLLVSAWNVEQLPDMALPPCHVMYQFYVTNNGKLDCFMYQRSADLFLGVPFNIASYALLTHMVAQVCGLEAGRLTMMLGDAHIYLNHMDQVEEMMLRRPRNSPSLVMNTEVKDINEFTFDDFQVVGYDPYPAIPAPIAV